MNAWLPYVVAGLGIPSTIFLIASVIRGIVIERGRGSLRSGSPVSSLDDDLASIDWDFPRWRLP